MQNSASGFQNLADDEIGRLVKGLESLIEGDLAVPMLVACGERAVAPLRQLLLHGRPSTIFSGRQRAVKALSELGAWSVLLDYLTALKAIRDPAVRYAEEAVENTAARELAQWQTDEVFAGLMKSLESRTLPGAIEAVAAFGRRGAIPVLIRALEDDVARPAARDALRKLRSLATANLIETVRSPEPSAKNEVPSSLLRRRSALQILGEGSLTDADWQLLRFLLYQRDPMLAVLAGQIALRIGHEPDRERAVVVGLEALDSNDWTVVAEAEQALVLNLQSVRGAVEREILNCLARPEARYRERLRLLYGVVRKAQERGGAA